MAASMTGMSQDEYAKMMLSGGRSPDGNRYLHERQAGPLRVKSNG
jgi:protocatechuate 4,5-dioxygenase alpha chain